MESRTEDRAGAGDGVHFRQCNAWESPDQVNFWTGLIRNIYEQVEKRISVDRTSPVNCVLSVLQ